MHLNMEMEYKDEYIKALLVEKLAGTISEEEELIVNRRLADSPEAFAYWQSLREKFQTSDSATFLSTIDEHSAWERVDQQLNEGGSDQERKGSSRRFTVWHYMSGAAAILLLALTGIWLMDKPKSSSALLVANKQVHLKTDGGEAIDLSTDRKFEVEGAAISNQSRELSYEHGDGGSMRWATLVVPATKDYKIKLDDGTAVWLNAASSLRFPFRFEGKVREVYLTGEAYFEVAKNAKVPFIVHTDYADINVHGTSFNVNAYDDESFAASLVEGSVSATKNNNSILLRPGQEVFARSGDLGLRPFDVESLTWRDGTYHFHRRSLAEIAQTLNRWYDVKIVWKSNASRTQLFTGEIDKKQPLSVVLSNLQLTSGIKSDLENGLLTFY